MSSDCFSASASTRSFTRARSTPVSQLPRPFTSTPSSGASWIVVITSAVAIRVFEGTQSVSTAAPPMPLRSTTVTWAPRRAATNAAS